MILQPEHLISTKVAVLYELLNLSYEPLKMVTLKVTFWH